LNKEKNSEISSFQKTMTEFRTKINLKKEQCIEVELSQLLKSHAYYIIIRQFELFEITAIQYEKLMVSFISIRSDPR
jgi:hypothetical protein